MHEVRKFAPCKPFYLLVFLFRQLKITLDSEQLMLKEKRLIPSVWGGIKSFEHFHWEASIFVHSINLLVDFVSSVSPSFAALNYFFDMPRFITFAEPALSLSSV